MALIDVVKYEFNDGEIVHKFHREDLRIGTQLVVYPGQVAFFVKGGEIFDEFTSGTHTIKTNNIPLLNKIINLPFGGSSPFQAEVWFFNLTNKLGLQWGTPQPILLEDPRYKIIVPVRSYGQYGILITNPKMFMETLLGNVSSFTTEVIDMFFKGKMISALNNLLAQQITCSGVSVLDINTKLLDLSGILNERLNEIFSRYGIKIVDFSIMSINVPENDDSVIRLRKAKNLAAQVAITGRDLYQMDRNFDILETAAKNEGIGGQILSMGIGLGAGASIGQTMGDNFKQTMTATPPIPQDSLYYLYVNGQQIPNLTSQQVNSYIQQGIANRETLIWTAGMPKWIKLCEMPAFGFLFPTSSPPPIDI